MSARDDEFPAFRPERFGPYLLERELASGGMATVYEAVRDAEGGFRRKLAVKRIHPHMARDAGFTAMFLDEARLAARIRHPNVCAVLDYGRQDGISYLAMELLQGSTLSQLLARLARRAPDGDAHVPIVLEIIAECAEGLHAAHELRDDGGAPLEVVHRDVSPQNLFVTRDGDIKVLDFGVARARNQDHRTATGEIKGKLGYMAPEQIAGRVDRRADVWALGVVLWEALTLTRLFRRDTQSATLIAVEREPIPVPSSRRAGLPEALDSLAMRALERDPDQRISDMHIFAELIAAARRTMGEAPSRRRRAMLLDELQRAASSTTEVPPSPVPTQPPDDGRTPSARTRALGASEPRPRRRWGWPAGLGGLALVAVGVLVFEQSLRSAPAATTSALIPDSGLVRTAPIEAAPAIGAVELVEVAPTIEAIEFVEAAPATHAIEPVEPSSASMPDPPTRVRSRPVRDRPSEPPPALAPGPAEPAPTAGPGRVTIPIGVALCFDAPCRDRGDAIFGPRTIMLPSGEHTAFYIEATGEAHGDALTTGTSTVLVTPHAASIVARH